MPRRPPAPGSPGWKDPRLNLSRVEFRPYATALGQIALAWNGLHERLAFLFCMVMGGGQVNHFFAIWYAIRNDGAQRNMLLAAANVDIANLSSYNPKLKQEVTWICKKCDDVEKARNIALHSPFVLMHSGVQPGYHMGHRSATHLAKQEDVLSQLRWCRDASKVLSDYVCAIDRALEDACHTWPDRPKWPTREDTNARRAKSNNNRQHPQRPSVEVGIWWFRSRTARATCWVSRLGRYLSAEHRDKHKN